jgi:hypothetical protein
MRQPKKTSVWQSWLVFDIPFFVIGFSKRRHPTSTQIANAIGPIAFDDSNALQAAQILDFDEAEHGRLRFSFLLFSLALAVVWAMARREAGGKEIDMGCIFAANGMILKRVPQVEEIRRIGDLVIDPYDMNHLPGVLRSELGLDVDSFNLSSTRLRFHEIALHVMAVRTQRAMETFFQSAQKTQGSVEEAQRAIILAFAYAILEQSSERYLVLINDEAPSNALRDLSKIEPFVEERYATLFRGMIEIFGPR